jgi:hypothetical protein
MDRVEFDEAPRRLYQMRMGTWVEFYEPHAFERRKRRGYVREMKDAHALVIDERSFGEVRRNP